jgi:hypothetical protein
LATAADSSETPVQQSADLPRPVSLEVEQSHHRRSNVGVVTSRTVFEFDESGKIRHPDVSVQQAR